MKTKVIFRKFKDGNVIALFPLEPGTDQTDCMSYMHVGQHSAATPLLVHDTDPASPDEYASLKAELETIGYDLEIAKRFPARAHDVRAAVVNRDKQENWERPSVGRPW